MKPVTTLLSKEDKEDPRLISYLTLRKAVGWLGISLAPAMVVGNLLLSNCTNIQETISHYYYTITGSLFVAIICSDALFLLAYKGYDKKDNIASNIAGIFALGIAFFPTNDDGVMRCSIFHFDDHALRNSIHLVSAACFFITLAYISLFLFTKCKGEVTEEKRKRNTIYKTCGIIILLSLVMIAIYWIFWEGSNLDKYKPVFILETIALFAFGISWLVKGELFLKDE